MQSRWRTIVRRTIPRKCLPQLMRSPLGRRMCSHCKVDDPPSFVRQHQKHVQHLKPDSRQGERVERHQAGSRRRSRMPHHVSAQDRVVDLDTEFSSSPWIFGAPQIGFTRLMVRYQLANFVRHLRTAWRASLKQPGPEQLKVLPLPSDDRGGFHDLDPRSPSRPRGTEPRPQQPVRSCKLWAFDRALKDTDLVAKRNNLLELQLTSAETTHPSAADPRYRRTNRLMLSRCYSRYRSLYD
jgi:hypothetical protein